jgi:purine-cytosine permease-like protein
MSEKKQNQPWWVLLTIQAGGTVCLPVIMVGQLACQKFGWLPAVLAVAFGNLFLLAIGVTLASLSTYRPQSTVQHAVTYFGNQGKILFAFLMMLSMLGWFGIQLNVMTLSLQQLFGMLDITLPPLLLNFSMGMILSMVMCLGMQAIKWLSSLSAPLAIFTLLYAVLSTSGSMPRAEPLTFSWLGAISLVIGANIAAVIDLPTFFRHSKSERDARVCILLLYGIIVPVIEIAGVYLSAVTGGSTVLDVLQSGHNQLWMVWTCYFIIISGWATNNTNLYSALTSSLSLTSKLSPYMRTILVGAIGTGIACFNPLGHIEGVLDTFSVTIGAMGAVILTSYLIERISNNYKQESWISVLSWIVGVVIGLTTTVYEIFLTGVPAFDAFLAAAIIQFIVYKKWGAYEITNS